MVRQRAIFWFRNDLRLSDNEALDQALKSSGEIIPVYVFDERYFDRDRYGFVRTGPFRKRFLVESVRDLQDQLRERSSGLVIRKGRPEDILPEISRKYGTDTVYASKEIAHEEVAIEEVLSGSLDLRLYHTSTLYHPDDIPFVPESVPDVFTDFRKKIEKQSGVRAVVPAPGTIKTPGIEENNADNVFEDILAGIPERDKRGVLDFRGGSREGMARIDHYIWKTGSIGNYKFTRNGLIGADYSGKFSPWLANGSVSPREIYREVKGFENKHGSNISTYWMIFELTWRDYFKYVALKYGKKIFLPGGIKGVPPPCEENGKLVSKWIEGKTGEPFVDANMRELALTGFMSNRGRQNVASYLVKDLKQNWLQGAAWFESLLIDYDPCSNYGNWMYVAGVGNDPRDDRYFNVKKQAERYDPDGEYVRLWLQG